MQTKKTAIKRLTVLFTVFALSVTALVATFMANRTQNAVAENSNAVSFTLGEAIGKAAYTDEELATAKGDDDTLSDDEKFSLYELAFSKSPLKFYAGTTYNNHTQYEYYSYINKSYHYYVGWTNINGISASVNSTNDKRLSATGSHNIYNDSHQIVWSIAYVAPSNGTLTIPAHTLYLDGGQATTESFYLGWSCDVGNRTTLSPDDQSLNMTIYDGKSDNVTINIPEQIYTLKKGEVVRLNMYSFGGSMWLTYNPTYNFVAEYEVESASMTLANEIAKVGYTDEELAASGWNGTATNNADREALLKSAVEKSNLKYYAFAGSNANGYQKIEYYDWANNGSGYFFNWTRLNTIGVWSLSTDYGLFADGTHKIGGSGHYYQTWIIGYTAPADGVLTIPAHTLNVKSFNLNATSFNLAWGKNYVTPFDANPAWTNYAEIGTYNIAEQTFEVKAGEMIYLTMYTERSEGSASTTIDYNPEFIFTEYVTLANEIAKVGYTDEELAASGWDGSSRDANKKALWKLAVEKSDLKYYAFAGSQSSYHLKEYYEWVSDGSGYFLNWTGLNTISAWSYGTDYGLFANGTHGIGGSGDQNQCWVVGWTAPADGVLTIPAHTLTINSFTNASALNLGWTKGSYITPWVANPTWTKYTATGSYDIAEQTFEVKAGEMVYLNMYADKTAASGKASIEYNPRFDFEAKSIPETGEVKYVTLTTAGDIGLNYYVALPTVGSAKASLQMTGSDAVVVDGVYDAYKGLWKFTYPVLAKDYDKDVTLKVIEVNGEEVDGATATYSVKDYIDYVKEDTTGNYDQVEAMITDLETFSQSANTYFSGADEVEKVTENVVASSDLEVYKASVSGQDDSVKLIGATLVLESKTSINVYFTANDNQTVCTVNGQSVTATKVDGEEDLYVVSVEVVAQDLGVMQEFVIGGYTLSYSAFSYIETAIDTANNGLYNLLQALYDYGVSAYDYFN